MHPQFAIRDNISSSALFYVRNLVAFVSIPHSLVDARVCCTCSVSRGISYPTEIQLYRSVVIYCNAAVLFETLIFLLRISAVDF